MSSAQYNRSLTTIKTELEFLLDSEVITKSLFDHINSCLPDKYTKGMPPVDYNGDSKLQSLQSSSSLPPPPSYQAPVDAPPIRKLAVPSTPVYIDFVEAIYDFQPQQSEDLQLYAGDKIKVIEKISDAWWKGDCNGRIGIFPSNYVRSISENGRNSPAPVPTPTPTPTYQPPQGYYQPPPPPQQQPQQMQMYTPPPPIQQPVVVQNVPMQQTSETGSTLRNIGSKLGDAALFGAGATIGSDIVNSIF
ncbi:hypothetical protein CANINC_003602 [Pichia inconspicua]|uniref:SH3 domain-containing protein n=1 Tax=Pichia inconspicua TaxID=52247 RepID=A0A4T0WYF7_9ASCO|nr:hypothetical protein CANINC_003602 [[Candida] inconspicua]